MGFLKLASRFMSNANYKTPLRPACKTALHIHRLIDIFMWLNIWYLICGTVNSETTRSCVSRLRPLKKALYKCSFLTERAFTQYAEEFPHLRNKHFLQNPAGNRACAVSGLAADGRHEVISYLSNLQASPHNPQAYTFYHTSQYLSSVFYHYFCPYRHFLHKYFTVIQQSK